MLAGSATIGATVAGVTAASTQPLTVVPGPVSLSQSVVATSKAGVVSGDTATLRLQAKDAAGNNLASGGLTVAFGLGATGTSTGIISPATDSGAGVYRAVFTGQTAGTARQVTATIGLQAVTSALPTIQVSPGLASPSTSTFSVSSNTSEPLGASNAWLLGKKKTYNGGSIFVNGPQFGWWNPGYVYELGLHGAGFDLVGNTPFGYPTILFGHNKDIAWGSTAGLGALVDIYEEQLCSTNPHATQVYGYLFNGQCLDMEKRTDTIIVKGGSPVLVDVFRTVHGLVVQFGPPPGVLPYNYAISSPPPGGSTGVAYSKKRSWEGYELESLIGWIECTRAANFSQ